MKNKIKGTEAFAQAQRHSNSPPASLHSPGRFSSCHAALCCAMQSSCTSKADDKGTSNTATIISMIKGLIMLLFLNTTQAWICTLCPCKTLDSWGWAANCNLMELKEMPHVNSSIKILHLQNNNLTTVPLGALDSLTNLEEINFSNNPWHCDCSILYLKEWLADFNKSSLAKAICATPASLNMKALSQLKGNELEGCRKPLPISCHDFFLRDFGLIILAIIVLILAACVLQRSKQLVFQASRKQHSSEVPLLWFHDQENQKSK
uniref:LRRCT domain-containing protein n=1 Tax=Naja naja TaxID=35670 RepID=A0A8C6YET4_NAJNA